MIFNEGDVVELMEPILDIPEGYTLPGLSPLDKMIPGNNPGQIGRVVADSGGPLIAVAFGESDDDWRPVLREHLRKM